MVSKSILALPHHLRAMPLASPRPQSPEKNSVFGFKCEVSAAESLHVAGILRGWRARNFLVLGSLGWFGAVICS